jgi:hypothetical protein
VSSGLDRANCAPVSEARRGRNATFHWRLAIRFQVVSKKVISDSNSRPSVRSAG